MTQRAIWMLNGPSLTLAEIMAAGQTIADVQICDLDKAEFDALIGITSDNILRTIVTEMFQFNLENISDTSENVAKWTKAIAQVPTMDRSELMAYVAEYLVLGG